MMNEKWKNIQELKKQASYEMSKIKGVGPDDMRKRLDVMKKFGLLPKKTLLKEMTTLEKLQLLFPNRITRIK